MFEPVINKKDFDMNDTIVTEKIKFRYYKNNLKNINDEMNKTKKYYENQDTYDYVYIELNKLLWYFENVLIKSINDKEKANNIISDRDIMAHQ